MRRWLPLVLLIPLTALVLRRIGISFAAGVVVLDERTLLQLGGKPLDLLVLGIATIPPGTPEDLLASSIRRLRIIGLLKADRAALGALSGKARVLAGAIDSDGP